MSSEKIGHDIETLDPSFSITQFCQVENISKLSWYTLQDKPEGYYVGDSFRIPQSSRLAWRARRIAASPEVAARQSEFARVRSAAATAARAARAKQEA
jgi:hypothetical protein